MKRLSAEEDAEMEGLGLEAAKASARLNMIINVASFVVVVGVLRIGKTYISSYSLL